MNKILFSVSLIFSVYFSLLFTACSNPVSSSNDKPLLSDTAEYVIYDKDFDGLDDKIDPAPEDNSYSAKFTNPGNALEDISSDFSFDISFSIDYRNFISDDNTQYSKRLSKLAMLFSTDAYPDRKIQISSNAIQQTENKHQNLYSQFGIKNLENFRLSDDKYSTDNDDLTEFFIGHHDMIYNNEKYKIVFITFRGTDGAQEWASNADVGADTERYRAISGETPEWTNKIDHKGFFITAGRALKHINSYCEKYADRTFAKRIFFVTGHSRGAAIANLIGKKLEDDREKVFTYTFACPRTTEADLKTRNSYKTIFNIVNTDDLVVQIPLKDWNFNRYGTDVNYSVEQNFKSEWKEICKKDRDYISGNASSWADSLSGLSATRKDLYNFQEDDFYEVRIMKKQINSIYIDNRYCKIIDHAAFDIASDDDMISCYICPSSILKLAMTCLNDPSNALSYAGGIELSTGHWMDLIGGLFGALTNISGIVDSHDCPSYWTLAGLIEN